MNEQTTIIKKLVHEVERRAGRAMATPKDFEFLQKLLPANGQLSMSTLKRLWNYVPCTHRPRECTLSILSQFAGYHDWADFQCQNADQSDSDFLDSTLKVADMETGTVIEVKWMPDRRCLLRKLANGRLQVVEAENCKLNYGDCFSCVWLTVGQPFYATHLMRDGQLLPDYVAGRHNGLTSLICHCCE